MAKVDYIKPIEALHGKISKSDAIGFARRNNINADEERVKYTFSFRKRKYNPTAGQTAQNNKFGAIGKLLAIRKKNATQSAQDLVAFRAQSTYKTLNEYMWHKCETEYNSLAGGGAA